MQEEYHPQALVRWETSVPWAELLTKLEAVKVIPTDLFSSRRFIKEVAQNQMIQMDASDKDISYKISNQPNHRHTESEASR